MNLDKLKSLMYVAELGSLSAASGSVHLTQAAISQHVKDLEREFGLRLINRSQRPVTLTEEGEELVAVARQMLRLLNDYKGRNQETNLKGKLVLGHVRSAITGIVVDALNLLRARHPQLVIQLVTGSGVTRYLAHEVVNRKLDASFGVGAYELPQELRWCRYLIERFYVIAPKQYKGKTDEELLTLGPYLHFKPRSHEITIVDREMKRRGIRARHSMELDSYGNILLLVQHNGGVGIVPDSCLSRQVFAQLYCIPFGNPPMTREMGLMVRHDSPNLPLVELLWNTIRDLSARQNIAS